MNVFHWREAEVQLHSGQRPEWADLGHPRVPAGRPIRGLANRPLSVRICRKADATRIAAEEPEWADLGHPVCPPDVRFED